MQVEALMLVHVYALFPQHAVGLRLGPAAPVPGETVTAYRTRSGSDCIAVSMTLPRIKATAAGGRTSDEP